jgi:hypothetical protein
MLCKTRCRRQGYYQFVRLGFTLRSGYLRRGTHLPLSSSWMRAHLHELHAPSRFRRFPPNSTASLSNQNRISTPHQRVLNAWYAFPIHNLSSFWFGIYFHSHPIFMYVYAVCACCAVPLRSSLLSIHHSNCFPSRNPPLFLSLKLLRFGPHRGYLAVPRLLWAFLNVVLLCRFLHPRKVCINKLLSVQMLYPGHPTHRRVPCFSIIIWAWGFSHDADELSQMLKRTLCGHLPRVTARFSE